MTNRKFVILGNVGEFAGWQLVLFPLCLFLLIKLKNVVFQGGAEGYRRWRFFHVLIAGNSATIALRRSVCI